MRRLVQNFKELSAKQIKTYAAIVIMSILSYEATASSNTEGGNSEPGMSPSAEILLEEEMVLENWMLTPFMPATAMETELAEVLVLENWMTVPFETIPVQRVCMGTDTCCPAP